MPTDQLKEAHAPLFEDNTSYHDPLKELEEWLRTEREKASFNTGILAPDTATWRMAQVSTLTIILAKIAEMRENKDV